MYHLKLIKGRSYTGIVSATRDKPDVYIKDSETTDKILTTGFFESVLNSPNEKTEVKPSKKKGEVNA